MKISRTLKGIPRYIALALVIAGGLFSIIATTVDDEEKDTQAYALVFTDFRKIVVRWSEDGLSWKDGKFPELPNWEATGVGIVAIPNQLLYLVGSVGGTDNTKEIRLVQGLGVENWSTEPVDDVLEDAMSAPSITYIGNGKWPVVYRAMRDNDPQQSRIAVRIFDTSVSPPVYLPPSDLPQDFFDTNALGRPAVAYVKGKILLAWLTQPFHLHLGVGEVQDGQIEWKRHIEYPLNEPNCKSPLSEPVLTHDHSSFYLGFLCVDYTVSHPSIDRQHFFILKSADGFNWSYYGDWRYHPEEGYGFPYGSHVSFAGRSDGSLLAAIIEPQRSRWVAKCSGGEQCKENAETRWQIINEQDVFGGKAPDWLSFSLIPTGHPAQSPP